ncbi:MAG: hypothetical protein PHU21_10630 [Elusimicrobia bacterium]|nr:hypothetical protein [Elusimicrobiota bacterium]
MSRVLHLLREGLFLVRRHKYYFLLPVLVALALLALLAYQLVPMTALTFVYAGL